MYQIDLSIYIYVCNTFEQYIIEHPTSHLKNDLSMQEQFLAPLRINVTLIISTDFRRKQLNLSFGLCHGNTANQNGGKPLDIHQYNMLTQCWPNADATLAQYWPKCWPSLPIQHRNLFLPCVHNFRLTTCTRVG